MKGESFPCTMHSIIHASLTMSIYGRSHHPSYESPIQQEMSYQTGVMMFRSSVDGHLLGEKLSTISISGLEKVNDNNTDRVDSMTKGFLKAISTSCKAMGYTEEAAKYARQCMFAMSDYHVLKSSFLSTTPDDECSFRVRLYCEPQFWVSSLIHL